MSPILFCKFYVEQSEKNGFKVAIEPTFVDSMSGVLPKKNRLYTQCTHPLSSWVSFGFLALAPKSLLGNFFRRARLEVASVSSARLFRHFDRADTKSQSPTRKNKMRYTAAKVALQEQLNKRGKKDRM